MASRFGSGSGSGKRPKYVDRNAPTPSNEDLWDMRSLTTSSNPSTSLEGSKKPKKVRNPNRLGKEYMDATREYVLRYYRRRSLEMLNQEFLDNGFDGFVNLCTNLRQEITDILDESKLYNNWTNFFKHIHWLDEIVTQNTTNVVVGTFEVVHKKNLGQSQYDIELEDML